MQNAYRPSLFRIALPLSAAVMLGLLAACSSPSPAPQQQFFETGSSPFSRTFNASSTAACEAARRALLNQGYLATATRPDTIDATRDFQPNNDKHITVEFHVVCAPGDDPDNTTTVYANAVQSGYALKKSDTSASVGFSVLGSVSLPIRSNSDSMVKVSSETIQSDPFYKQFFEYVAHYLHTPPRTQAIPPAAIEAAPLPDSPIRTVMPPAAAMLPTTSTPTPTFTPAGSPTPAPTAAAAPQPPQAAASAADTDPAMSTLPAPLVGPGPVKAVQPAPPATSPASAAVPATPAP